MSIKNLEAITNIETITNLEEITNLEPTAFSPEIEDEQAVENESRKTGKRDNQGLFATKPPQEQAILVGVSLDNQPGLLTLDDSLAELTLLASTADLNVVRQQRELEKVLGEDTKVIDRTALILDIFASHARTREGSVQVELAQYEYRLPRLTRAWTHLVRQAGGRAGGASGGVGVRGPGETQLEVDRREIGRRISFLKGQLEEIRTHRTQYRRQRRQSHLPEIALVGYTNAGKSTLLNALSNANVLAQDQLFATLDPTTRRVDLPSNRTVLFSDTVGASFRATLEEVNDADILLHVVDLSHPNMDAQIAAVEEVLEELGAGDKIIITALNKADQVETADPEMAERINVALTELPNPVVISAKEGQGLDDLQGAIDEVLRRQLSAIDVLVPYSRGDLIALVHEHGIVESEEHLAEGTHLIGRLPDEMASRYEGMMYSAETND